LRGFRKKGKKLNKTGTFLQYNMKQKDVLWNRNIDYQTDRTEHCGGFLFKNEYLIDVSTGKKLWKVKHDIYFIDSKKNICIG